MVLFPLPPVQQAIAGTLQTVQQWYQYFVSLDKTVRSILASSPNTQTASYTLQLSDANGIVEMNVAGANNLTVPLNSAIPFQIGTTIRATQIGAGTTTIIATGGVTIRNRSGLNFAGQYAVAFLYKRGTDDWMAYGDLV